MADKLDLKKTDKAYYAGKVGRWDQIKVAKATFLRIEGQGDPGGPDYARAMEALYPIAYTLKFAQKAKGADFVVPPQQSQWWADDPDAFLRGDRDMWKWAATIRLPDGITEADVEGARDVAVAKQAKKRGDIGALAKVSFYALEEGLCLQSLHVGPYTDEAPILADLHDRLMPELGLTFNGPHHEIYLSDPRRIAPEKLRTILRQPVRPL